MHAYIRALGFDKDVTFLDTEAIIKAGLDAAVKGKRVHFIEEKKKVFYRVPLSNTTGFSVVCDYDASDSTNPYILDYYTPYLLPDGFTKVDTLFIERHVANDSYGLLTDEIKDGATLVSFLDNAFEMGLYSDRTIGVTDALLGISGLCLSGTIILPIKKVSRKEEIEKRNNRRINIERANEGDEEAMEQLALEDFDNFYSIARRIGREDILTIVESTFIPCGVECETYSILGDITALSQEVNVITGQVCYNMHIMCDDIDFNVLINKADLVGEPKVGRRFKGCIWLMSHVRITEQTRQHEE